MIQKTIRDFNGVEFSVAEAAEWHKEFNDRTRSSQNGYNSVDELATKLQALEVTAASLGIEDIENLQAALDAKEPAFTKNKAFNKNFGKTAGTVMEGSWRPSWADVSGKPATFTPSAHNHDDRYYTETESDERFVNITGDSMTGSLITKGITITSNSSTQYHKPFAINSLNGNLKAFFEQPNTEEFYNFYIKDHNNGTKVGLSPNGDSFLNGGDFTVSGKVTANRFAAGFDGGVVNSMSCSNWFRSNGQTGWYSTDYQCGIRAVASKELELYGGSTNLRFDGTGRIRRYSHLSGYLEGSYNTVAANDLKTNPIYVIGSNYIPGEETLSNFYGIGFSHSNASFLNSADLGVTPSSGWGFYGAADGNARWFLNASNGNACFGGHVYANQGIFRGNVTANSDKRLKKNFKIIPNALEKVSQLNGYTFDRKDMELSQAGIIAQEVQKVLPVAVSKGEDGMLRVDSGNALSALLIEAIKELKTMIDK